MFNLSEEALLLGFDSLAIGGLLLRTGDSEWFNFDFSGFTGTKGCQGFEFG